MIGLVVSRADSASVAIGAALRSLAEWETHEDATRSDADGGGTYYRHGDFELREFDAWHLELDGVAEAFSTPPSVVAFLSRHSGETGPLLTAHFTGNFGPAEYGGEPGELARACPNVQRAVVGAFDRHAPDGYEVGIECTHHGPSDVGAPSLFVELGSSEAEWNDPAGAEAVARAVLELADVSPDATSTGSGAAPRQIVGFGGGHYAPQFERILRETDWAIGHVAADWVRKSMGDPEANAGVIERAFEQSAATRALVADDDPALEAVVEDLGYRVVGETRLRATTGVDLALVERLEAALSPIESGLRLGAPAKEVETVAVPDASGGDAGDAPDGDDGAPSDSDAGDAPDGDALADASESGILVDASDSNVPAGAFSVVSLPDDLLAEASGIDQKAAMAAAEDTLVAFETVEGGTIPQGRAAVGDAGGVDSLVNALVAILVEKYDEVTVEDARVTATRETFDPAVAAAAGVPEGPAFGRLSAGETVDVDGREVTPAEVHTEETVTFPIGDAAQSVRAE
ncbi:hypothetical protein DVK02_03070 [Halobellus sp. Atlit-31R]|nr:hypothetical protein DVK02_03070 [Halobellus sp. Atlit-31R]